MEGIANEEHFSVYEKVPGDSCVPGFRRAVDFG